MKIEIKSQYNATVLFAHRCKNNSIKMTLEAAVKSGANLRCSDLCSADLCSADLRYAKLRYANLGYANLCSANLRYANLCSANLYGADLRYADLCSADLRYADLCGADLRCAALNGAIIADGFVCDGKFHHITNVGSEGGTLEMYSCGDSDWYIKRGCFGGSKQEFLDAVNKTHGDNEHGQKYRAIVDLFCGEQQ